MHHTIGLMKGVKAVCASSGEEGKLGANLRVSDGIVVVRRGLTPQRYRSKNDPGTPLMTGPFGARCIASSTRQGTRMTARTGKGTTG